MPARFKQLYERTERSSSSIVISKIFSFLSSSFSTMISTSDTWSVRLMNCERYSLMIFAASDTASSAPMLPFVETSSVSLSKSVIWPTRVFSTEKLTFVTGVNSESIGMTPIGILADLLRSAST